MIKPHGEDTRQHNSVTTLHHDKSTKRNLTTSIHHDKTTPRNEVITPHHDNNTSRQDYIPGHNEETTKHNEVTTTHNKETSVNNNKQPHKKVMAFHKSLLCSLNEQLKVGRNVMLPSHLAMSFIIMYTKSGDEINK